MDRLCDVIEHKGPTEFTRADLDHENDLFAQRAALFYTPTTEIPDKWIGAGPFKVELPIASPRYFDYVELRGYSTPRLWVDLLQRATWKLRWTPFRRSRVTIVRHDMTEDPYAMVGAKALLDALKWRTTGRADGQLLYYFGVIEDDSPRHIEYEFRQEHTSHPSDAHCTIEVQPLGAAA